MKKVLSAITVIWFYGISGYAIDAGGTMVDFVND